MQNISKGVIVIIILNTISVAEEITSFFMDNEDSKKALLFAKQSNNEKTQKHTELKLSGIFFIDEQNWTIWLNGVAYSEYVQHENFSIDEVSESKITVTTSDGDILILAVK